MNAISKLLVSLGLDASEYHEGMDKAEKKAGKTGGEIARSLVAGGGKLLAMGLAGAAAGATAIAAATLGPASDLQETMSKVGVVFGDSAADVLAFGSNSASALGMSSNAALSAAGTYGNLFRSMGMAEETSADMSTSLVTLAGDLASFNNMDPTEVLDKLRAGLTGETEPLKALGVNLNAAAIEAKALEMGLVGAGEELTPAAKAQASYALIMEQTALAQGDFARTSDGLANSKRRLGATIENLRAKIGTGLLPAAEMITNKLGEWGEQVSPMVESAVERLGNWISGTLVPGIESLANWITGSLIPGFQNFLVAIEPVTNFVRDNLMPILAGLGAVILGVVIWAFVSWATAAWATAAATIAANSAMILSMLPIIAVIAAIGLVVGLFAAAWQGNWGGIRDKLTEVWNKVQPVLQTLWDWLGTTLTNAIQTLSDYWTNTLQPALLTVWAWVQDNLVPLFEALGELFNVTLTLALTAMAGLWENVLQPALNTVWEFIQNNVMPILNTLWDFITNSIGTALADFTTWLGNVTGGFDGISTAIDGVIGWIESMIKKLKNIKLPDWLTPGSPTPFEMGLWGISKAMQQLAQQELPEMTAALRLGDVNGVSLRGETTGSRTSQYTLNLYSNAGTEEIARDFEAMTAWAS